MLISFNSVTQGASHIEKGTPCQDAAFSFSDPQKKFSIVIVADGHGGEKYFRSEVGSKTAVDETKSILWGFDKALFESASRENLYDMANDREIFLKKTIPLLEQKIIRTWREKVLGHFTTNSLSEKEKEICAKYKLSLKNDDEITSLYGTTLLAVYMTPICYFAIQIGDGLCVKIDEKGECALAIPEDERQGFGSTNSLCDPQALNFFHSCYGTDKIQGLVVATDGVVDSYERDKYFDFLVKLRENFITARATTERELKKFLPTLSERGSRDDCAIAGIWRTL